MTTLTVTATCVWSKSCSNCHAKSVTTARPHPNTMRAAGPVYAGPVRCVLGVLCSGGGGGSLGHRDRPACRAFGAAADGLLESGSSTSPSREGRHFAVYLFVHTKHSRKAGRFSVARLKADLPFHNFLACHNREVPSWSRIPFGAPL